MAISRSWLVFLVVVLVLAYVQGSPILGHLFGKHNKGGFGHGGGHHGGDHGGHHGGSFAFSSASSSAGHGGHSSAHSSAASGSFDY